jgi:hypothetical protein
LRAEGCVWEFEIEVWGPLPVATRERAKMEANVFIAGNVKLCTQCNDVFELTRVNAVEWQQHTQARATNNTKLSSAGSVQQLWLALHGVAGWRSINFYFPDC